MTRLIDNAIPEEVADLALDHDISSVQAWRLHLGLSQDEVAKKMGVSHSTYAHYEQSKKLRKTTLIEIAKALSLKVEQLNF